MNKLLLLATTFATFMASAPLAAHAGNVSEVIPIRSPYHYGGGNPYPYPGNDEDDDDDNYEERISCWEGRREVRQSGFRNVRAVRCSGDIYRYRATRRGKIWSVRLDAWSGQIVSVKVIGYH